MNKANDIAAQFTLAEVTSGGNPLAHVRPLLAAATAALSSTAADWLIRYRDRHKALAAHNAMRHLDDHLLRDLGFSPRAARSAATDLSDEFRHDRDRFTQSYFDFLR